MKTRKPISTISYNSSTFLQYTLDRLVKDKIICFWYYIEHNPEPANNFELAEKKAHKHIFCIPNKTIDTMELGEKFIEPDYDSDKPLKCMSWRSSSESDALLYDMHYPEYIRIKGLERKYHYDLDEFITSDLDELKEIYNKSMLNKSLVMKKYGQLINSGKSLNTLVYEGYITPNQIKDFKEYYSCYINGYEESQKNLSGSCKEKYRYHSDYEKNYLQNQSESSIIK